VDKYILVTVVDGIEMVASA